MKEEALKLADSYEVRANFISEHHEKSGKLRMSTTNQATIKRHKKTADIIRRLVEELDRLVGAEPITHGKLTFCKNCGQQDPYTQTKPLSDEEIVKVFIENYGYNIPENIVNSAIEFARAIEERHGIK